jgi:hypothetical protein
MNGIAFEYGAGTSLAYGPLVATGGASATSHLIDRVQHYAVGAHTLGRFVYPAGTYPPDPTRANAIGWPGMWPTLHVFAEFDPASAPTSGIALHCSISSDDDPGSAGSLTCADYECDATSLHVTDRGAKVITPGADGFATWKYGLWTINYLQVMHDDQEAGVDAVPDDELALVGTADYPVHLGSSDIEGFQAQMFIDMVNNRADDWLLRLTTTDGATLSGFASIAAAQQYSYASPLRTFPRVQVSESDTGGAFPQPSYALAAGDVDAMDLVGLAMGYAEFYALTDPANVDVGGAQPAAAYFDGDPFDGSLRERALAMMRVAVIDLDRGPAPATTTQVAYEAIGLRTVLRALSSQLELYSNNTPDSAFGATPLDAFAIAYPGDATLTFTARVEQMIHAQADLLFDQLTDPTGRAYGAIGDPSDTLDSHAAAIRGLFAVYLATGDSRYFNRALAVFDRMDKTFYDPAARIYSVEPAPVDAVTWTPLRFALVQSALRDMYELVAARPGGELLEPVLEDRLGRLNKLVLNGWDDRDGDRIVAWPDECVNVVDGLPRGGLQMAERTLTGEIGLLQEHLIPGMMPNPTSDRESDCVPEIDDAKLPAALADAVTFHIQRGS